MKPFPAWCFTRLRAHWISAGACLFLGMACGIAASGGTPAQDAGTPRTNVSQTPPLTVVHQSAPAASAPAGLPMSEPDPKAMQADILLRAFPGNANALTARSDARNFTVEGKVREVHTETPATGLAETYVVLAGKTQAADSPAHFTCRIDQASASVAVRLKINDVIRITGAIAGSNVPGNRIDLQGGHDIKLIGTPLMDDIIIGRWHAFTTVFDGVSQRRDMQAAGMDASQVPNNLYMGPGLFIDLEFKPDHTITAVLRDINVIKRSVAGKWRLTKGDDGSHIVINVEGEPEREGRITFSGEDLSFFMPGFSNLYMLPGISCDRVEGTPAKIDWKTMRDQGMNWVTANNSLKSPQQMLGNVSSFMDELDAGNGYTIVIGSGLTKRARTTAIVGYFGKFYVLEYSDAEVALNADKKMGVTTSKMKMWWGPILMPEAKIDSLVIDNRTGIDRKKPITGKLTMHTVGPIYHGGWSAVLAYEKTLMFCYFKQAPGPDARTFDLSFSPFSTTDNPTALNPRVAMFYVARTTDMEPKAVCEPIPMLLDVLPDK